MGVDNAARVFAATVDDGVDPYTFGSNFREYAVSF